MIPFIKELGELDPRKIVGLALARLIETEPRLAVLYADVGRRFGLDEFKKKGGFSLEMGISEQNMIGVAAGMCHEGMFPVVLTYAPFVTGRVFDQIKSSIGEMQLPIGLIGSASGLGKGDLGSLLTCTDDISMLRTIPGMQIICPADGFELFKGIDAAVKSRKPFYVRMTGASNMPPVYRGDFSFEIGKSVRLREGNRLLVITCGSVTSEVLRACDRLAAEGKPVAVLNMHTVEPLDTETLQSFMKFEKIITIEEHCIRGGLGGAVAECLAERGHHPTLIRKGVSGKYFVADHYDRLLWKAGLKADLLYNEFLSYLL